MSNLEQFFGQRRAEAIAAQITPFLGREALVADIGAGDCRVSEQVRRRIGRIVPIDILDTNVTDLDLMRYDDGDALPLGDNAVDASLLVFVLHHATDQSRVFKEAKRITKPDGQIIVVEDTPQSLAQESLCRVIHERQHKRNPSLPEVHDTKTVSEWQEFFNQHNSGIIGLHSFRDIRISNGFYQHSLFVLDNEREAD